MANITNGFSKTVKNNSGSKTQFSIERANEMTLEEIFEFSNPRTQNALLSRLTPTRRTELKDECEKQIYCMAEATGRVGQAAVGSNNFKVVSPYTQMQRYSHMFTVLAGWMSKEDLEIRDHGVMGILNEARSKSN